MVLWKLSVKLSDILSWITTVLSAWFIEIRQLSYGFLIEIFFLVYLFKKIEIVYLTLLGRIVFVPWINLQASLRFYSYDWQRRRTALDELNMRSIFEENDVICVSPVYLSLTYSSKHGLMINLF